MKQEKWFRTRDIHLSTYLELKGIEVQLEISDGFVDFAFPLSDQLYSLITRFNGNDFVGVTDYVSRLRILRGRMLSLKNEDKDGLKTQGRVDQKRGQYGTRR